MSSLKAGPSVLRALRAASAGRMPLAPRHLVPTGPKHTLTLQDVELGALRRDAELRDATKQITIGLKPMVAHNFDEAALPTVAKTDKLELIEYYKTMYTMRRMEIAADVLYKGKHVKGFLHLYDGQEAVGMGIEAATTYGDSIVTSYRDHTYQYTRGSSVAQVFGELLGKYTGPAKGKGGSMHMYHAEHRFYGGNGIVGAQTTLGAGLGFAHQYRGDGGVALSLYGDGAANQGQLFEAMNLAALWKLPIIFVCENNQYGMGTSASRGSADTRYYARGQYIPGLKVDGMNVLAVREAVRFAAEHARTSGPVVMEMDTYRYHGHSMSDPGISYRNRDEVSAVRSERDPVELVKSWLLEHELATKEELKAIDRGVRAEIEAAVEAAKAAPVPPQSELYRDVFVGPFDPPRPVVLEH